MITVSDMKSFEIELTQLINRYSLENHSNTPDFVIARFMTDAFHNFVEATNRRDVWYDRKPGLGGMQI